MKLRKSGKLMLVIVSVLCMVLLAGSMSAFAAESEFGIEVDVENADLQAILDKGVLVVGITDFAPMDYKDDNGEWIGFDADLARLFAEDMGVDVEFQEIDWDNKILELNAGTVDCIWNGMTLTDEVDAAMECSITYALNAQVVVMKSDALADYPDAESMKDLSFAVEAGSAGEAVAEENGFTVNAVQNQAAALMEVAAGTSDACVIDKTMADAMTGEGTSYETLGYKLSLSSEEYVVGFRKGSAAPEWLNLMFLAWMADGTMEKLAEKYDNAVSISEVDFESLFAESAEGESPEGESPEGESPENVSAEEETEGAAPTAEEKPAK